MRNYIALMAWSFMGGMAFAFLDLLLEFFIAHPDYEIRRSDVMVIFLGGISFAILLFLVVSIMSMVSERTIKKKYGPIESWDPVQSRTMTVRKDYQTVFEKCLKSLEVIGAKVVASDSSQGWIKASTGRSWRSSGESIEIKVSLKETDTIEVAISSISKVPGPVFDYGIGVVNVEELRKAIMGEG